MPNGEEWRRRVRQARARRAAQQRLQKGRHRVRDPYAQAQPGVYYSPDRLRREDDHDGDTA